MAPPFRIAWRALRYRWKVLVLRHRRRPQGRRPRDDVVWVRFVVTVAAWALPGGITTTARAGARTGEILLSSHHGGLLPEFLAWESSRW
jgi:hypothetical protein